MDSGDDGNLDADDIAGGAPARMHNDEFAINANLVRELISRQFPEWKDLPLSRVPSSGTVNAIYRLGNDLSIRLPRTARFQDWDTDCWLAALGGLLPLPIPEPMGTRARCTSGDRRAGRHPLGPVARQHSR